MRHAQLALPALLELLVLTTATDAANAPGVTTDNAIRTADAESVARRTDTTNANNHAAIGSASGSGSAIGATGAD